MATVTVTILKPAPLYEVVGDEDLVDWGYKSRTLTIPGDFTQLPSVMRFSPVPLYDPGDYRVDESWLKSDYIRINNYDGDGLRRCENYLWKDNTALYNNKGFPFRQYLTMSRNLLRGTLEGDYLRFDTLKPTEDASHMTIDSHPHIVHRFDLVGHKPDKTTYHTYTTPRGNVYFFLTSREGYGYIHKRFVKEG